ncbi:MAG: blue (type 1) copper domain protein [Acidimicrobiales bacterium]|nr:blue (type 1) copper domain protein [Acidimicrobiales bacterium]
MKATRTLTASLVALLLVGAGCGKSKDTSSDTGSTAKPAPSSAPAGSGSTVDIKDFTFSPKVLNVKVGTAVRWTNDDGNTHTVTSDGGSESFDSKDIKSGASFSHTFKKAGTFTYQCGIHNYMKGTVTVS